MATRFYPKITYVTKVYKNGKMVQSTDTARKMQNLSQTSTRFKQNRKIEVYCRVNYAKGIYNDGTFTNFSDYRKALNAWTEKPLLDHIYSGEWT